MGYSISWIAVKDRKLSQVLIELGLTDTGETEEIPETDISGADFPNGWCHIQFNDFDNPFVKEEALAFISSETQTIYCQIEEHVMYSKACCWEGGQLRWSCEHSAQEDLLHLSAKGNLPNRYEAIKAEHIKLQEEEGDDVDYIFEIPVVLAEEITSFRYDAIPSEEENIVYQVLRIRREFNAKSKPWWKIWKNV